MGHEILNSIDELIGKKCEFYDDDYYKGTFTIVGHEVSIEDGSNSNREMKDNEIDRFVRRLKRIGIEVQMAANVPWIYLYKINGNLVKREDYNSKHGYTVAWYPVRMGSEPYLDPDLKRTFNIIRKYR